MRVELSKLKIDDTLYPRGAVSEFNVARLCNALEVGTKLPPITVEADSFRIIDGRHRYEAYLKQGLKTIDATVKSYARDADAYADAIRLNIAHGVALTQYNIRSAIIRLTDYGYTKDAISEVVKLPIEQIEKIERGFASDTQGHPVPLKGGLSHLAQTSLDDEQIKVNRRYSGPKATFYVRQILELLRNDMWPQTQAFIAEMDDLCAEWQKIKTKAKAS